MARQPDNPITLLYNERMSSQEEIVLSAINTVIRARGDSSDNIKSGFSEYLLDIERETHRVFLEKQENAGRPALKQYLEEKTSESSTKVDVINAVTDSFNVLIAFFLSLSQARRARAGSAFEFIIKDLFKRLDYPFDEQEVINGKPDFLFPSRVHFDRNPMDCIIFTVKRKVRERWRQIVTEGTRGLGFFLATIDKDVSRKQLKEMLANRIHLVLPATTLAEKQDYQQSVNAISFEDFFANWLDPAMNRWRKNKIIE